MATLAQIYNQTLSASSETTPIEADNVVNVRGTYGKLRHRGNLSPNNPYRSQLALASTNADRDALFELAVKWEADRSQDEWQLEQNRQILEEQRSYDDPTARIARERRAGINSDIAGGTSAGSSGGSSSMPYQAPDSDVTDSNARFFNVYDNVSSVTSAIGTTIDFIKTASSLVSGFTLLPSQLRISNAQADLAEGTLDAAQSLARSQASSAELSALNDRIDFVGRLSSFVQPNSDESTVRNLFSSLGVPAENMDSVYGLYNHYKNSDSMQSEYNERQLRRKDTEARNMSYTSTLLQGIYQNEAEAKNLRAQSDYFIQQINNAINGELAKDSNITAAQEKVTNELLSSRDKSQLERKTISRNIEAFDNYIRYIKTTIKASKAHQQQILGDKKFTDLSAEKQALVMKENLRQWALFTCGSDSVQQAISILNGYIIDRYNTNANFGGNAVPSPILTSSDFINTFFGTGSEEEGLLTKLFNGSIDVALKSIK